MSFLGAYTAPTDPRWHGSQRRGPLLLLPMTFLFIIIWILFISDQVYSRVLWNQYEPAHKEAVRTKDFSNVPNQPLTRWGGADPNGAANFAFRASFALLPELIHLPLTHYLVQTSHLHPVAALSTGLIFASLWLVSAVWSFIVVDPAFTEYGYPGDATFESLVRGGAGLQVALLVCYVAYVTFAAIAVSRWRKAKKDGNAYREGVKMGMELSGGVGQKKGREGESV
ncbi:hypothetical protein K505DRAFT_311831 [Melanomma pulvis-pyrius CBS 109.77]|uniref:Uncharacterized protein n=1 Tax=Melanomma pulvis-pyrius CBS 109.77 TaxID=1314802 RepID=A0A6A6X225_9PLEO|nr:hypothetical protein K505DRAFT_311831 [Melanomma pulvis-pyrius CBS 109.77]